MEHLRDQMHRGQPDQQLLDELGWSRDDLARFLQRWEQMKRDAQSSGAADDARHHLDEALRSLGLRPARVVRGADASLEDKVRGLREGRRSTPPPEYAEQYRAYTQGTARGSDQ